MFQRVDGSTLSFITPEQRKEVSHQFMQNIGVELMRAEIRGWELAITL